MTTFLCVTAHPDDEAGNFGGAILKYHALGKATALVCLTGGGAARNRGGAQSDEELIRMRTAELGRACELLNVANWQVWDLPDSAVRKAPFYETAGRLVKVMRELRPAVVLTFGPEGGATAHTDHGATGLLATAAFHWAARAEQFPEHGAPHQAQRLFYSTAAVQPPHALPVKMPPVDVELDIAAYLDRKLAAFEAHLSQAPLFPRIRDFFHHQRAIERFHLAAAAPGFDKSVLGRGDLLAGL